MVSVRNRFGATAFIGALRAISMGMAGNMLDFRRRGYEDMPEPKVQPGSSFRKKATRRKANLRLHLGPSDAGRLMRNRTPAPTPVRLTCHDWFRRQHFGSSKRIRNMDDAERTSANAAMEEYRRAQKKV